MNELIRDILKDEYPDSVIDHIQWVIDTNEPVVTAMVSHKDHHFIPGPVDIPLSRLISHIYEVAKNA